MNRLLAKSLLIWVSILPLAIANGTLREYILLPWLGDAAYPLSGLILCVVLFLVTSVFLPRLGRGDKRTYIRMGVLWVVCTILMETLLGLVSGDNWFVILNNYNILSGNLWLLVVLFFGITPWLVAKGKGFFEPEQ